MKDLVVFPMVLAIIGSLPCCVVSYIFAAKIKDLTKITCFVLASFSLVFVVASFICATVALEIGTKSGYNSVHTLVYAALFLGIFAFLTSLGSLALTFLLYFTGKARYRRLANGEPVYGQTTKTVIYNEPKVDSNGDYLEQLKRLKELLDSGAITQEEYDLLKKQKIDKLK